MLETTEVFQLRWIWIILPKMFTQLMYLILQKHARELIQQQSSFAVFYIIDR